VLRQHYRDGRQKVNEGPQSAGWLWLLAGFGCWLALAAGWLWLLLALAAAGFGCCWLDI